MEANHKTHGLWYSWLLVFFMLAIIFGKGYLAYWVIGDLGQPDWDYRPIADVPGESPYAVYETLPHPPHVTGAKGE